MPLTICRLLIASAANDFSRWYTIANTRIWANQSICKVWNCYVQPFKRRCIYKKVHYFTFDLDLRSRTHTKRCPVSSTSYVICTCKVWSCYAQQFRRKCIYKKYLIWQGQGHIKHCPLHHCYLSTCKVWSCYGQWLRRCITKNTLFDLDPKVKGWRSHKMLPSTLDFMWPIRQQSLMLLHPMVKEKMHFQRNTLIDLALGVKVTQNVAQYPRLHVTYAPAKFDIATSHG